MWKQTILGCMKDLGEKKKGVCVCEDGDVFFSFWNRQKVRERERLCIFERSE